MSIDSDKKLDAVKRTIATLKQYESGRRYWPWQRNPVTEALDLIAELVNRPSMTDEQWQQADEQMRGMFNQASNASANAYNQNFQGNSAGTRWLSEQMGYGRPGDNNLGI